MNHGNLKGPPPCQCQVYVVTTDSNLGFPKMRYPTTMGFPTKNDHFGVFGGTTIEGNTYVCAGISPPLKADS